MCRAELKKGLHHHYRWAGILEVGMIQARTLEAATELERSPALTMTKIESLAAPAECIPLATHGNARLSQCSRARS